MKSRICQLLDTVKWNQITYKDVETEDTDSRDGHTLLEKGL